MDYKQIEKKWQNIWADEKLYDFDDNDLDNKYYVLEMFSYPSGAKLHVGHWYNYGPSDSFARFMRMHGKNVFQPMGFDAFGLPAENYAIKTGVHPQDSTLKNIATMEKQLRDMGASFDWNHEVKTCMPDYYKWTQWLFLKLYEKGLAYRKEAPVNWCTSCNTVLANEQVLADGTCERCGSQVIKKDLTQWFFKITEYAEELLQKIDDLDWPQKTKLMQKNWIGKSVGAELKFQIENSEDSFNVFTTRVDTVFGVSFVVLAPEHPLVDKLTTAENKQKVEDYKLQCSKASEIDRTSTTREKTGVFTGSYAINPANGKKVPIFIADYVLYSYGTGAVMGVAAHDERDFVFAQKYNLPIVRVVQGKTDDLPFCEYGTLVNSEKYDGLTSEQALEEIPNDLAKQDKGQKKINYRLRDWLVSRQRYWGAPIPVVHCEHCGIVPVPEKDLPVLLPYEVEFKPDGKSPLAKCNDFINCTCPKCGKPAKRDADTLDTFVCSSWYFLRYADAHNSEKAFDSEIINKVLPVDKYIGGAEHACMHLLYARFFTKALRDMGLLNFDEPFLSLVHQGTILGPDGNKMSKSRGNVISPDKYIEEYGSDVFRTYLMFGFSYIEGGAWSEDGIKSIAKFLDRCERIVTKAYSQKFGEKWGKEEKELDYARNYCIKQVENDMRVFSFNTSIARIMEFVNSLFKYDNGEKNDKLFKDCVCDLLKLLAPITPHFAEELWQQIGNKKSIFKEKFPVCDEKALVLDEVELALQINAKIKGKIVIPNGLSTKEIEDIARQSDYAKGLNIVKIIVVPNRLVNIIAR